jgi:hypothetical protein
MPMTHRQRVLQENGVTNVDTNLLRSSEDVVKATSSNTYYCGVNDEACT